MGVGNEIKAILCRRLKNCPALNHLEFDKLCEIRLRAGAPVFLNMEYGWRFLGENSLTADSVEAVIAQPQDISEILEYATGYSVYAYEEELANGFITVRGGHRVGVCGRAVMEHGKIKNLRNISSLNIRVAHEIKGCASMIFPHLLEKDGSICHALIYSSPGKGKTTLLRDLVRLISDEAQKNVSVVDERFEIGSEYLGVVQKNLGMRTDVLSGCPKDVGMEMMLRAMAPQVIAVDELGGEKDFQTVQKMAFCGVSVLATIHAGSVEELESLFEKSIFRRYIGLTGQNGTHYAKVFDEKKILLWEGNL